ncbi:MAG: hypothetical protein A2285_01990 [Elusimicrobia bacterium RIFOXYA12_FULL_57_11]|nr:MAG: hypothetical protein A2285_01990 [Elusimicrobia bacterium RIFOXYA12_FULL_57_11]
MRFFRFRIVNTLLFFLVGILIGFIFKERLHPALKSTPVQRYQPEFTGDFAAPVQPQENSSWEEDSASPGEKPLPAGDNPRQKDQDAPQAVPAEDREEGPEISLEPDTGAAADPEIKPAAVLQADPDQFFKRPAVYAGREIEMSLQMITARRTAGGWRLNFVHVGPEKKLDYLYVDDAEVLGENPDLRIGYVYRVKFRCNKGDIAGGNVLSAVEATGAKADWATGLSAVE